MVLEKTPIQVDVVKLHFVGQHVCGIVRVVSTCIMWERGKEI